MGRRHQQRKHDGCPESTVSHHNGEQPDPVLEKTGECPEQHTHTTPSAGWVEAIQKQNRECCPSNFPSIFFIVIIP